MENGQCLATKTIMEGNAKVGYMFREAADFDGDSGWRIFTGDESLDFIDDDDNIDIYELQDIMNQDPAVTQYLSSPIGTELERVAGSDEFITVVSE